MPHCICEAEHVDGSMNATEKEEKINWLKAETPEDTCRILSNVRCLSEGVDVPALDAVLFLTPRNSQIDVVQSVGRVMRSAPGKTRGYIVLPVVIPANMEPHEALNDNEVYRVVWQVLQALRSHDDRFDAMVNKLDLTGEDPSKMEVIAITDKLSKPRRATIGATASVRSGRGEGRSIGGTLSHGMRADDQRDLRVRDRRDRARHLRQTRSKSRESTSLGRLGEGHRKDRTRTHRPHHRHHREPCERA